MSANMNASLDSPQGCPPFIALVPNDNPKANRGGQVVAGSIALLILPTIAVVLRLLSRWMARARLWWDDYTIVAALIFSWGPNILNIVISYHGFGKHAHEVTCPEWVTILKVIYAFMIIYYLALGLVKTSIILFQYRIFPIIHFRRILFGCNVFVVCWLVACLLTAIFQCNSPANFWRTFDMQCLSLRSYLKISGGINTATNFILLAMPIPLLWNLRASKIQKLILTIIFTMGLVVCAVSIVRLILVAHPGGSYQDFTYSYALTSIWTAAEPSIAVVSACLPSLRPLFAQLCSRQSYESKGTSHTDSTRIVGGLGHPWPRSRQASDVDDKRVGGFNRLRDSSQGLTEGYSSWTNKFSAHGGHIAGVGEEYDIGAASDAGDRNSMLPPARGIRVRTTVTVSEKVDYQDDLF